MQPSEPGDQELVAGCLKNDAASWRVFVDRFSRLVHWSIRKTLASSSAPGREELIREIFQEFFERLLEKNELAKLRDTGSLRKFLSVMACHMALDKLKGLSRYARKNSPLESVLENNEDAALAFLPADPLLQGEADSLLAEALKELSSKEQACLRFHYEEGRTHAETGRLLGMPEDTVSTVLRRTREKLRKKLSEKGYSL